MYFFLRLAGILFLPGGAAFFEDPGEELFAGFVGAALFAGEFGFGGDEAAFDGGFQDSGFVAFEVGLDTLEIGDGFVEAGELFFDFGDDALLLCNRWYRDFELPEVLVVPPITSVRKLRSSHPVKKIFRCNKSRRSENFYTFRSHGKWTIHEFNRSGVITEKDDWELSFKGKSGVINIASNKRLSLINHRQPAIR